MAVLATGVLVSCGGGGSGSPPATPQTAPLIAAAASAPASEAASAPSGAAVWQKIASEGDDFSVSAQTAVRYGSIDRWALKTVSGIASCTSAFFGFDPIFGTAKQCEMNVGSPQPPPPVALPIVDVSQLAVPAPGWSTARISPADVSNPSQRPVPSDLGAFREPCNFSHMSFDDPIVYPGQPGKSHLHAFFGNTATHAGTTAATLAASGNSTCAGGILNRSAYWVPAMIDTRTGAPVKPASSIFYYKTGYLGISPATVKAFPPGLRMVSGDPSNSIPAGPFAYGCIGPAASYWAGQGIPNCAIGEDLIMSVDFPNCWDGVNLDSPDHISHMTRPSGGACPATHPVPVPEITFVVHYTIGPNDAPSKWRLSSDNYDPALPAGYSGHGDWFNGWDTATMNAFVKNCEQASMDCHAYLLGDGRTLY